MDFKVIISQPAIEDLKNIVRYIGPTMTGTGSTPVAPAHPFIFRSASSLFHKSPQLPSKGVHSFSRVP